MRVAILGGGISGLTAAYYLSISKKASKIYLLEKTDRVGGWINSFKYKDKFHLELGPRTLRCSGYAGANTLALAEKIGIKDVDIIGITSEHHSSRNRFIKVGNNLHPVPNSISALFRKRPPFSKPIAFMLAKDVFASSVTNNDESIYSFVNRRFGREIAQYLIDPLVRGIYAGNAKDISVKSLISSLHYGEQNYGYAFLGLLNNTHKYIKNKKVYNSKFVKKAKKEKWTVWSLKNGLEQLVHTVHANVIKNGVELHMETSVEAVKWHNNEIIINTNQGELVADAVISCIPAKSASTAFKDSFYELYCLLSSINYVTVAVVHIMYSGQVCPHEAFGYLIPSSESSKVLGVIFDSSVFSHKENTVFTVMLGGYWFNSLKDASPSDLLDVALMEISSTLHISEQPVYTKVSVLRNCIPQYSVGHSSIIYNIRKLCSDAKLPVFFVGNSFDGVGINDAILSSLQCVNTIGG